MKSIAIIQARMGASRLPGKVLFPLGDSCVLDYVVSRCQAIEGINETVVATTRAEQDDEVEAWCRSNLISVYRGSEEHVLSRFLEAAATYQPDYILRVTADNPFFDYRLASRLVAAAASERTDFVVLEKGHPTGLAVELVSYAALQRIGSLASQQRHIEHVTYYAYEFPEQFQFTRIALPDSLKAPNLRITVDTEADYALCGTVAEAYGGDKTVSTEEVVRYLLDHPETRALNSHIAQKPVT